MLGAHLAPLGGCHFADTRALATARRHRAILSCSVTRMHAFRSANVNRCESGSPGDARRRSAVDPKEPALLVRARARVRATHPRRAGIAYNRAMTERAAATRPSKAGAGTRRL